MTRARELLTTIVVQGIGSVAMFGTIAVLARTLGPAGQGAFSLVKAEVDFLTAVALMGMPQALFYFSRSGRKGTSSCVALVIAHALAAVPAIVIWFMFSPDALGPSGSGIAAVSMLAITVAFSVAYGDLRGLVLATHSSVWFSLVSASPNVLLLGIVGVAAWVVPQGLTVHLVGVPLFFATYALSLAVASVGYVGRIEALAMRATKLVGSFRELLPFGVLTWIPAILQTALVLFVLHWVRGVGNGSDATGVFSTALTLTAIAVTPLSLAVPILFKWWMSLDEQNRRREVAITIVLATAIVAAMWLVLWRWEVEVVGAAFGPQFIEYAGVYSALFLATIPQVALKVFGVYCNSCGRPAIAAGVEAGRAMLILGAVVLMGTTLTDSVYAWVVGEFASLVLCATVYWLLSAVRVRQA